MSKKSFVICWFLCALQLCPLFVGDNPHQGVKVGWKDLRQPKTPLCIGNIVGVGLSEPNNSHFFYQVGGFRCHIVAPFEVFYETLRLKKSPQGQNVHWSVIECIYKSTLCKHLVWAK